jgi:hypothetical protein
LRYIFCREGLIYKEAFQKVPFISDVQNCVAATTNHLLCPKAGLLNLMDELNVLVENEIGKAILSAISIGGESLTMQKAILIALFSPHVQMPGMSTSPIDAHISEVKINRPREVVKIFTTILTTGNLSLKSGYTCPQPQVRDGKIVVNMKNKNRDNIFGNQGMAKCLESVGILNNSNYEVRIPVFDMNDIFFADILKLTSESFAGNIGFDNGCLYYTNGILCFLPLLKSHDTAARGVCDALHFIKESAEELRKNNSLATYMRIVICMHGKKIARTMEIVNIFIYRILKFDLGSIEDGDDYCIGTFSCIDIDGIVRLGVKKIGNKLEFVIQRHDFTDITDIEVTTIWEFQRRKAVAFHGTTPIVRQKSSQGLCSYESLCIRVVQ